MAEKLSEKFGIRMGSSSSAPPRRKTGKKRRQMYSHMQKMMEKGGFLLLWMAVGLDLLISILGYPMIGQAVSATIVVVYLLYNVSLKKLVCSFWFTVIDFFFREISVGGETKLEALRDNRAIVFCVAPHVNQFIGVLPLPHAHVAWALFPSHLLHPRSAPSTAATATPLSNIFTPTHSVPAIRTPPLRSIITTTLSSSVLGFRV